MGKLPVLAVVAAGGAIGAVGRYGLTVALPHQPTHFPWATFVTNATGCFAIGVLMVVVLDLLPGRPLLRPFLGVGVLGGFTTFSTYALEIQRMVDAGARGTAMLYLAGTVVAALAAGYAGSRITRRVLASRHQRSRKRSRQATAVAQAEQASKQRSRKRSSRQQRRSADEAVRPRPAPHRVRR